MNVFEQALLNTLMGMGTVFAVLIFISLLISLFVYIPSIERPCMGIVYRVEFDEDNINSFLPLVDEYINMILNDKKFVYQLTPREFEEVVEEEELVDDGELVAVITAAIMAANGGAAVSADKLVVRSIKRVKRRQQKCILGIFL